MSIIISFVNQKGGVGKTTSTVNFAAALSKVGRSVLCIDADPQGNMSSYLGYEPDGGVTLGELIAAVVNDQEIDPETAIRVSPEGIPFIPATVTLAGAEMLLVNAMCGEQVINTIVRSNLLTRFEYILIDSLPSLGILLTNVLAASDQLIIPVQAQKFALDGLVQLDAIALKVKKNLNHTLKLGGVLLTMADNTSMSKAVEDALMERYGELLFETHIHRLVEATYSTYEQVTLVNAKNSRLGAEYIAATNELLERTQDQCDSLSQVAATSTMGATTRRG